MSRPKSLGPPSHLDHPYFIGRDVRVTRRVSSGENFRSLSYGYTSKLVEVGTQFSRKLLKRFFVIY
jgi:hypothetical protein